MNNTYSTKTFVLILAVLLVIILSSAAYVFLAPETKLIDTAQLLSTTNVTNNSSETQPKQPPLANNTQNTIAPPTISGENDVIVKINSANQLVSDIFLKNKQTGKVTSFMSISDVYRGHYHNSEYHNGSLYIIRRTGGDDGYRTNPNWTDELWKYDLNKQGQKIYTERGLDFRVSNDDKYVAIIANEDRKIILLSGSGVTKTFNDKDLNLAKDNRVGFLTWAQDVLWVEEGVEMGIDAILKIDMPTFKISNFDVADLHIESRDFALNTDKQRIVFSDYPVILDVVGNDELMASKAKIILYVYDLLTKNKQVIATSTTKSFSPKWISQDTIQFDNPKGEGVLTKVIH